MPTYEYICKDCGDRFEHFQSMSSPPLKKHSGCREKGESVERIISGGTGLIFKGSGFYLTDYKKSENKKTTDKNNSDSKKNTSNKKNNDKTKGKTE